MSLHDPQPFMDSLAFKKSTNVYVPFQTDSDAMLASLQLFHDVPCRFMDLFFAVVTHPDFDPRQVTLRNSTDMIKVVEESRLKDRMAVVHERSANRNDRVAHARFPHFVLYEVLDIIHAERMHDMDKTTSRYYWTYDKQHALLSNISLVHRSWTLPAQNVLGRILYLRKTMNNTDNTEFLHSPVKESIFGPWTCCLAMVFSGSGYDRHDNENDDDDESGSEPEAGPGSGSNDDFEYFALRFELLRRLLLTFTNLKCIYIASVRSFPLYTRFFTPIIADLMQQNKQLETLFLYNNHSQERCDPFILDAIANNENLTETIRTLNIIGPVFHTCDENQSWKTAFKGLRRLKIENPAPYGCRLSSPVTILSILSSHSYPHLTFLSMVYTSPRQEPELELTTEQWATAFGQLSALDLDNIRADRWIKWIPHCPNLRDLTPLCHSSNRHLSLEILSCLPSTIEKLKLAIGHTDEILHEWREHFSAAFRASNFLVLQELSIIIKVSRRDTDAKTAAAHFHDVMDTICMNAGVRISDTMLYTTGMDRYHVQIVTNYSQFLYYPLCIIRLYMEDWP